MATIQPFRAIRPNPLYADQLIDIKSMNGFRPGKEDHPEILGALKILLETGARQSETPEAQMRAYQETINNLEALLYGQRLLKEEISGIYIYEFERNNLKQTGVWALTALEDYGNGNIKVHEQTIKDKVHRLKSYRLHTGFESNPILLTYPPDRTINRLIAGIKKGPPRMEIGNENRRHRLWKTKDAQIIQQLTDAFASIPVTYLADGHHRLESAVELAQEQHEVNDTAYDTISSLYMASDQIQIKEYNRVIVPDQLIDAPELFRALSKDFVIQESTGNRPVQPIESHRIGMYLYGQWYHLLAKAHNYENKPLSAAIDATIIQEYILAPIFKISDPKSDPRLKYAGGEKAMEEIGALLQSHPGAIAFTLCPLKVDQLTRVAEENETLPPKSTWIDPKVPYGLLLYQYY